MDSCLNCGGAIGEPGKPYGYAGKWCHCPAHPSRMYQSPARNPLRVLPMFADPEDMDRYSRLREFYEHRSTPEYPYIRIT